VDERKGKKGRKGKEENEGVSLGVDRASAPEGADDPYPHHLDTGQPSYTSCQVGRVCNMMWHNVR
jgi:hypothetical protein